MKTSPPRRSTDHKPSRLWAGKRAALGVAVITALLIASVASFVLPGERSPVEEAVAQDTLHPTVESRKLTQTNTQNEFIVSLDRIERARDETRLFLNVHNTSAHAVSMYEDSTALVQGDGTKLEPMRKYSVSNKRALLGTYPPGAKSSSQITYPTVTSLDDLSFYSIPPYTNISNLDWYEIELAIE